MRLRHSFGEMTNAKIAASFGADRILLNGIDVLNPEIAGLTDQSKVENPFKRRMAISAFIIILSMTISLVGLTNIIKYGYGYCGCLAIAIVVPFLTVGVYKKRKA